MNLIIQFIYAFIATIGYAIFFQLPKKLIVYSGLTGAFGWIVYVLLTNIGSSMAFANLSSAVAVAVLSEIFARISKNPVTMFVIPGILPITPGYSLYMTMYHLTQNDIANAVQRGLSTLTVAGSIAVGVMLVSSFGKISRKLLEKKLYKKNDIEDIL